jgi:hypothetical protein
MNPSRNRKLNITIFIDHDIMVRHFIHSRVFGSLENKHNVTYVFPEENNNRQKINPDDMGLKACWLRVKISHKRLLLWRTLFLTSQIKWKPGAHNKALRVLYRGVLPWKPKVLYSILSLPLIFNILKYVLLSKLTTEKNHYMEAVIDEVKPDVILHPTVMEGLFVNELVTISKEKNIPLIMIMNSWDNPSTKRAMVYNPDWLLVWGEQTCKHAVKYANMMKDRVKIFGAAQFEVYKQKPRISRDKFLSTHKIPSNSRVLLYAGSSKETNEYEHLKSIENAIINNEIKNTYVIYRPHPWGNGGLNGHRIMEYNWHYVRIESSMLSYMNAIKNKDESMTFPDYKDTHDVLSNVDALVSPLSTIILEGALHGMPVLCYLPSEKDAKHFKLTEGLTHFKDMFSSKEIHLAYSSEELIVEINNMLDSISKESARTKIIEMTDYFVKSFSEPYQERLLNFTEEVVFNEY